MELQPTMEIRSSAKLCLALGVLALAGLPRAARAQGLMRVDTTTAHVFGGQPFRLDALTPWRRGGGSFSTLHEPAPSVAAADDEPTMSPTTSAIGSGRPFRFRSGRTTATPSSSRGGSKDTPGFLTALANALIPVLGITRDQLHDSFGNPRPGHHHAGIDIPAPKGTPVVAAVDGSVLKMKWDNGGGRTIRLLDESGKFVFYYAHLSGYARGLQEGAPVRKGQVLGYVGRTGRVIGSSHLHLAVASLLDDADHWWNARPLNPYVLLKHALGLACDSATAAGSPCSVSADSTH